MSEQENLQDSKKPKFVDVTKDGGETISHSFILNGGNMIFNYAKIEQNQKIADMIKEAYNMAKDTEWFATDEYSNTINHLIKEVTGKDIKELL